MNLVIQMNKTILLTIAKSVILVNLGVLLDVVFLCDSGELSDFGEYGITCYSDDSGGFGDSGDFYEPADSCESDDFNKTVHSVDS